MSARRTAKADRRRTLLDAAARLFAESGFNGVSIEDLGAAVGISGPALYRHFSSKLAVLTALLVEISSDLLEGGREVVAGQTGESDADALSRLEALIRFHVAFAVGNPDVIRVQDRDLGSLGEDGSHRVRSLQRAYVDLWVDALRRLHPGAETAVLRLRAHAAFGLMNSTPHGARELDTETVRGELERLARIVLVGERRLSGA